MCCAEGAVREAELDPWPKANKRQKQKTKANRNKSFLMQDSLSALGTEYRLLATQLLQMLCSRCGNNGPRVYQNFFSAPGMTTNASTGAALPTSGSSFSS